MLLFEGRWNRVFFEVLFWTALLAVALLSLIPSPPPVPLSFNGLDKLQHLGAYGFLGFFRGISLQRRLGRKDVLIMAAILTSFGGALELLQAFTGRTPEFWDLVADGLGALAGGALALLWSRRAG
jgi:VanZ family protein